MAVIRWLLGKIILFLDALFAPKAVARAPEAQRRVEAALKGHSIYQFEACPFCVKVRRFLKASAISLPLRDAKEEKYRAELLAGGGKVQVPCLRIQREDGSEQWLYESSDIIAYLQSRLA
jgi:glutaredoxin